MIKFIDQVNSFLCKVNKVTCDHRHGNNIQKKDLDKLSNAQLDIEKAVEEFKLSIPTGACAGDNPCEFWEKTGYTTDFKKDWGFCKHPDEQMKECVACPMEDFGCNKWKAKKKD